MDKRKHRLIVQDRPFSLHFTIRGTAYQYDKINKIVYQTGLEIARWDKPARELLELAEDCIDSIEFEEKLKENI